MKHLIKHIFSLILLHTIGVIYSQSIGNNLDAHNEVKISNVDSLNSISNYYLAHRFSDQFEGCKKFSINKYEDEIIQSLLIGDCFFYGQKKDNSKAYESYLLALNKANKIGLQKLEIEALRKLIFYGLFVQTNLSDTRNFIDRHLDLSYDSLELNYNKYFDLRYKEELVHVEGNNLRDSRKDFQSLLNEIEEKSFPRIETEVRCSYAIKLEEFEQYDQSIKQHLLAIESAKEVSERYAQDIEFTSLANIGALLKDIGRYREARPYLQRTAKMNLPNINLANRAKLNLWISEVFENEGKHDSAYYYLQLSHQDYIQNSAAEHATAVLEIQSKYDNEKLEKDLLDHKNELLQSRAYFAIAAGSLILLTLLGIALNYYQRLRRQTIESELQATKTRAALDATKAEMEGEQKERQVIASMLHDQVASLLTAANMHLSVAEKKSDSENQAYLQKTKGILTDVNHHVRNLSHQLVSPALMKFGLEPALDSLTDKLDTSYIRIHFKSTFGKERLENSKEIFVYRSCAELIQNVLKHSNGDRVDVLLCKKDGKLSLEVRDNGTHQNPSKNPQLGLGLTHICSRAEALNGSFSITMNENGTIALLVISY